MKNLFKWFGLIALVAVIGFTFAACGDGSGNGGGGGTGGGGGGGGGSGTGGTFTLTSIPSQYNGKYAWLAGGAFMEDGNNAATTRLLTGEQDPRGSGDGTACQISNGRVSIPLWSTTATMSYVRYSGNHTIGFQIQILNTSTIKSFLDGGNESQTVGFANFEVAFSNGSASRAWSDAEDSEDWSQR